MTETTKAPEAPDMEQRAVVVWQHGTDNNVGELNELLEHGWRLVSLSRMSGWSQSMVCALALVERRQLAERGANHA